MTWVIAWGQQVEDSKILQQQPEADFLSFESIHVPVVLWGPGRLSVAIHRLITLLLARRRLGI